MRRWILPVLLAVLMIGAATMAIVSDRDEPAPDAPAPDAELVTPVLSARRNPEWLQRPGGGARLNLALEELYDQLSDDTCVVVSDGGTLVSHNPTLPVVPASNQKLLVGAAVLEELGSEGMFHTAATSEAPVQDGSIGGDLYLVGGGDPVLITTDFLAQYEEPQVSTDFGVLADRIVAAGVTEITGNVVGDDGRYDPIRTVPSWPDRGLTQSRPGPLSALAVNRGFESFPDSPESEASPQAAAEPPAHAASLMVALLEERGVDVQGQATKGLEPTGATEIASVDSPPMRDIVRQMMSDSDNTGAEMLLKELGLHRLGQGTTEGGTQALTEILGEMGLPLDGVIVRDGSGLHDENRVTCALLVALLEETGSDSQLADTMAVAGETGTLRTCHVGTPATGNVRAKSGRLREASALSGFIETVAGQDLIFAYVTNGDSVDQSDCPDAREALIESLVIFPEGPPASDLEPLAPTGGS